jgi:type IV pilus assembly protein PilY1
MKAYRDILRAFFAGALVAGTLLASSRVEADDTSLFSSNVAPNVLILQDDSGSMNEVVWHPAYISGGTYPTDYTYPLCTDPNLISYAGGTGTVFLTSSVSKTFCGRTRTLYVDPALALLPSPNSTRWILAYMEWYFSQNADPYVSDILSTNNGTYSSCLGGGTYSKYMRSKLTAAKQVLRDVICQVNATGKVRFGIATFRTNNDDGGYVTVPVNDYDSTQATALANGITAIDADAWTPLGETLYQLYTYFMSRNTSNIPKGKNGVTPFSPYQFSTNGSKSSSSAPPSPVQYKCQKNFVIIITDGESTQDDFTCDSSNSCIGFGNFSTLIGDYNPDGEVEGPFTTGPFAPNGTKYLDDIAMYMHQNDFRPDMDGNQTIDVYTIGLTTGPAANALLQKTAQVGGGLFAHSDHPDDLTSAIVNAIADIIQKSQSLTAAAVPASRTSDNGSLYAAQFIPSGVNPMWEGHLYRFQILSDGTIRGPGGVCAVNDPSGACQSGSIITSDAFWDAANAVPAPALRNLSTSKLVSGIPAKVPFDQTLTAADLNVTYPPAPTGVTATTADGVKNAIVDYIRGCVLGSSPCVARTSLLGDIFHSNPLVVGAPFTAVDEPSHDAFSTTWANRRKVIYAGANDGFLHGFDAGAADGSDIGDGHELFGFMPYPSRQTIKQLAYTTGTRSFYFVDGSPQAADVWFYTQPKQTVKASDGSEWHTVLMGGLRQGGNAYYALDVTNPASANFPSYLWEFPAENDASGIGAYMGQTWSEPVITRIKVQVSGDDNNGLGYERWVAIVGAGYDPTGDPNSGATYNPAATAGRGILVIDLETGKVLAEKLFGVAPGQQADMLYAIPSQPAVLDLDFDGFADVVYIGDLGGNIWKWVVKAPADDVINGTGDVTQPQWGFSKVFQAPVTTYTDATNVVHSHYKSFFFPPSAVLKNNKLWLGIGSGERADINAVPDTSKGGDALNRFYAFTDLDPLMKASPALATLLEANLDDHTGVDDSTCNPLTSRGYFFDARPAEKFVTASDIFFYYLFIGAFTPTASADPCDTGGSATLYDFKIYCGQGAFPSNSGDAQRRLELGAGMPTAPQISIGGSWGGGSGGGGPQCPAGNRVIVQTSNGGLGGTGAPCQSDPGVRLLYWRQAQ